MRKRKKEREEKERERENQAYVNALKSALIAEVFSDEQKQQITYLKDSKYKYSPPKKRYLTLIIILPCLISFCRVPAFPYSHQMHNNGAIVYIVMSSWEHNTSING
uniref:Uncharacterized protein n=1 Tax=Micrurus carvalhoi TaxID=3147026 RepID=A0A2H6MXZ4_9SAUR